MNPKKNLIVIALLVFFLISAQGVQGEIPKTLNDGLIAYYEFEGNANDSTASGYHGTEYGGLSYVEGKIGQAANLDGIDDYISVSPINLPSGDFTVSVWFKSGSDQYAQTIVTNYVCCSYANTGFYMGVYSYKAQNSPKASFICGAAYLEPYGVYYDNKWHHLVGISNQLTNSTSLYIDGQLALKLNGTYVETQELLLIGICEKTYPECGSGHNNFNGLIDDLRIYNRVISEIEVQKLYSSIYKNIPKTMSYRSSLIKSTGFPYPVGAYNIRFEIVDSNDAVLWQEEHIVEINFFYMNVYEVLLGETNPIDLPFDEDYKIRVVDITTPPDYLVEEKPLASVGYAYRAEYCNFADAVFDSTDNTYKEIKEVKVVETENADYALEAGHAATAGDADTVDGKHADEFLDTSANTQTKTGGLNIQGNVGIGTADPTEKLEVAGTVKATKFVGNGFDSTTTKGCYVSYSGSCLSGFNNMGSVGDWGFCYYDFSGSAGLAFFRPPGGGCCNRCASGSLGTAYVCCQ